MATTSDEKPLRIPFSPSISTRDGTCAKDAKILDGYLEQDAEGQVWLRKRGGLAFSFSDVARPTADGQGCFYWTTPDKLYYALQGKLRSKDSGGVLADVGVINYSSGLKYWFCTTLGTPSYLYLSNGTGGYTVSSAGAFAAIGGAYPGTTLPGAAYLDGSVYILSQSGLVYGSALNDPTTWSALNTIVPQASSNFPVGIASQLAYVIVFLSETIEVFYDAANATGSALLPVPNAHVPIGCSGGYSIQSINDELYFVGRGANAAPSIYKLSGLKLKKISSSAVDRVIARYYPFTISWQAKYLGHTFYVLNTQIPILGNNYSLVFDIEVGDWYFWSVQATDHAADALRNTDYFQGALLNGSFVGGLFYHLDQDSYLDGGVVPFVLDVTTSQVDGGTLLRKVLTKFRIVSDSGSVSPLFVSWSDDDYDTWCPWLAVDVSNIATTLTNLGTFERRAFRFRYEGLASYRMQAAEVTVLLGSI